MSSISSTYMVTDASDVADTRAFMGGSDSDIATIELGPEYGDRVVMHVHSTLLTTAEQVAWLLDLAAKASALAEKIEARAGQPVSA